VVRDTVERPPGELGLSKAVEYYSFPLQFFLTVGNWATGGYPACKKLGVALLVVTILIGALHVLY